MLLATLQANLVLSILGAIAGLLLLHFFGQYLFRGLLLRGRLKGLRRQVAELGDTPPSRIKAILEKIFEGTQVDRAWKEYEETLHEQFSIIDGEPRIVAIRATLPAQSFLNLDTVVDPWIGSEYFKHLPGILTGFGIIGTFFGLIQGLIHFDPNAIEPSALKAGLGELFGHVRDAFMFSGSAIACAIVVTILEKWLYASCGKWVFQLSMALDERFRAGVGEEYLSSLVKATQDNAGQLRQLKEAMVEDLKPFLTNLTDRQVLATQQLSTDLSDRIRQSLQEPLAEIAQTVKEASGQQHEAVGGVLEQLMTSFMAQMRETLGGQIGDLSGLMRESARAMASVELAMKGLVADMQRAGDDSIAGVQTAVRELMQQLSEHQSTQGRLVSDAANGVFAQLQEVISRIAVSQEEMVKRTGEANEAAAAETQRHMAILSDANAATMAETRETLDKFGSVSSEMIDRLSDGAARVASAVGSVHEASERLAKLASQLGNLESQTRQSSQAVAQASIQLATAAQGIVNAVGQLGTVSTRLEGVARSATLESEARNSLLANLKDVIGKSQAASAEFAKLTEEVRDTLELSFESFGTGVSKVLSEQLALYQKQLGDAVGMLHGALDELAEYANRDRD
jgi:uncharacterized protein YbjQ (UPF0145 family)